MYKVVLGKMALLLIMFGGGAASLHSQQPPTIDEYLMSKGIQNTPSGLRLALKSHDPESRGVAASLLAANGDIRALSWIKEALETEEVDRVRLQMSAALARLQDLQGNAKLIERCTDANRAPASRISAAAHLLEAGDNSCLSSVLDLLNGKPSSRVRQMGLLYLQRSQFVQSWLFPDLMKGLIAALNDSAPGNRLEASRQLARFGNHEAVAPLERAVEREKDAPTREHMLPILAELKRRLGH